MSHSTAAPADDNRGPFDCACRETWDGDPAELCYDCRREYDFWCDEQAAAAAAEDRWAAQAAALNLDGPPAPARLRPDHVHKLAAEAARELLAALTPGYRDLCLLDLADLATHLDPPGFRPLSALAALAPLRN